jgi:HD superfamily phosphohydrolase
VSQKNTLFNDPIYGFITIESDLILNLINHPYFQRLRRISQMGLSSLVYPGAHHTRFEHAIGAMHVMQKAIELLVKKGVKISRKESEAMQIAILLHDIGHGPFSHASEKALLQGVSHETLSVSAIELLNQEFGGQLELALQIFKNTSPRTFMNQLVSGQIDVDRLDYLKRDSFYTGVTEGNINTDRIIAMMNVENEQLVFESKGVHSLEKFLLARRLMYWQVYLHKTSLAAELLLVKILERFRELVFLGKEDLSSSHMLYPLLHFQKDNSLTKELLLHYLTLEDADIFHLIKQWTKHEDLVLSKLSQQLFYRKLPKIKIQETPFTQNQIDTVRNKWQHLSQNPKELDYFVYSGSVYNQTYRSDHAQIWLKNKTAEIKPLAETIDYLDFNHFSKPIYRYYLCYPKHPFSL